MLDRMSKFCPPAVFGVLVAGEAYAATYTEGVATPPAGFFGPSGHLINFDQTPAGQPIPSGTLITNQYAALGVIFNEDDPRRFPRVFSTAVYDFVDAVSSPNSLFQGDPETRSISYPIIIDFKDDAFSQLPTRVGFAFIDASENNPLLVQVFDAANNLIESTQIDLDWNASYIPLPGDNEDTFIGFESPGGISRIYMATDHIDQYQISFEIDDLQFNGTLVPEPATLGLLAVGLLFGCARRGRRCRGNS